MEGRLIPVTVKKSLHMVGTVKWYNIKKKYGFINRNNASEDIFVHHTAITRQHPQKTKQRNVGKGEIAEFDIVGGQSWEADNVTGSDGRPVQGSPYAVERRCFRSHWSPRQDCYYPIPYTQSSTKHRLQQTSGGVSVT